MGMAEPTVRRGRIFGVERNKWGWSHAQVCAHRRRAPRSSAAALAARRPALAPRARWDPASAWGPLTLHGMGPPPRHTHAT